VYESIGLEAINRSQGASTAYSLQQLRLLND
jgi:hypothetical protein